MKSMSKFAVPLLTLAIGSATAYAQAPRDTDDDDRQQPRTTQQQTQPGAQQPSQTQQQQQAQQRAQQPSQTQQQQTQQQQRSTGGAMALEQVVLNEPELLEGKAVTTERGQEIGEIERLVTKMSDNMVYAVIKTEADEQAAVRLSELTIAALEADISADELEDHEYRESEFEPVQSQSQAAQPGQSRAGQAGEQPRTAQGGQPGQAADTAPGGRSGSQAAQRQAGQADMPALAQLAMSDPSSLQGKTLMDEDGEELGEIQRIVRSRTDNEYYAVVAAAGNTQAAVPLEELQIGKIVYEGTPQELEQQTFQESEYRAVSQVR